MDGMLREVDYCHDFCHPSRPSMECLGRYTFIVMTSVILSGGVKIRVEHGMLREVYIYCHDFCHTFRSSRMLGEVQICTLFLLCRFIYRFICSLPGSTFICRLICSLQTAAMPHPLRPRAQKQIDKNTMSWFYKDNDNDNNNTRTNT